MTNTIQTRKDSLILLFSCLFLGILFDFLFHDEGIGLNLVIFTLIFQGIFIVLMMRNGLKFRLIHIFTSIILILLLLPFMLFSNDIFSGWNFTLIVFLILFLNVSLSNGFSFQWEAIAFLKNLFDRVFPEMLKNFFKPFRASMGSIRKKSEDPEKKSNPYTKKILIGLLISLPLLIVVISLLVAADEAFERFITITIPELLKKINFSKMISHLFFILLITILGLGYMGNLIQQSIHKNNPVLNKNDINKRWDPIIILTVLIVMNLIYLLFAGVLFSYLFATKETTLTFAQYARKGFFELIVVAAINFIMFVSIIRHMKDVSSKLTLKVHIFLTLLVSLTFILLYSSFHRLYLYQEAYGFTFSRLFAYAIMLALFLFLIICLIRIWTNKIKLFPSTIIISLVIYASINYLNFDSLIARKNIDLYFKTNKLDLPYLQTLSYDAIPELMRIKDIEVYQQSLNSYLLSIKIKLNEKASWKTWNRSRDNARFILNKNY